MTNLFLRKSFSQVSDKLYRISLWMLSDKQEAEDIVQDVFLKLSQKNLFNIENFDAYAARATKNLCLDKIKRRKFVDKNVEVEKMEIESDDIAKNYEINESLEITKNAIGKLQNLQKLVLELRHIEGYSIDELSTILEIEPNYARVLLSRARKNLTEELSKKYKNEKIY